MIDWQPIETAPNVHGMRVLLALDSKDTPYTVAKRWREGEHVDGQYVERWTWIAQVELHGSWGYYPAQPPTHWAPIDPPTDQVKKP